MAFYDLVWYANAGDQSTTGHYAVAKRPQNAAVTAGQLVRQFTAPAVGSERVFICVVAGTTANTTDATWTLTRGAKSTDGTATWQEVTGIAAVNGDLTNTVNWTQAKAIGTPTLGAIIQRNNGASYWICSTAGTMGASEPAWSNNTAGTTQADGTTTWTCLGVVGNFTGGQAPHARIPNAATVNWFAAGNTIYVGDNHAESQATAITIAPAGGAGLICKILCHNHSGSYPPASSDLRTGATLSNTGNVTLTINSASSIYVYGLTFKAGIGQSSSGQFLVIENSNQAMGLYENCSFQLFSTGAAYIQISAAGTPNNIIFNNCTVYFAATTQFISPQSVDLIWRNTGQVLASGSSVPANFILPQVTAFQNVELEALDLSQLTGIIFANQGAVATLGRVTVKDCKLNAAASVSTPISSDAVVQLVRSDSSATAYKSARYAYEGTETTETSITRVGGASDPTGQAQSRKIVTTANSQWLRPFKAEPYAIWNPTTGANVTVTIYGTINAGALPNNDDIWLEVEYLGSSASPLGTIVTTTKANLLAANAAVASDGSTWNNTGSAPTTFNPADLNNITLSNVNLTATGTGVNAGVRSVGSISSGKYYWEYTYTTINTNGFGVGIATASYSLSSGSAAGSADVVRLSGSIYINGSYSGIDLSTLNNGNVIGVAIDVTNKLIWFRIAPAGNWNNSGTANPATGTGGLSISALSGALYGLMTAGNGDVCTANFGVSAFSGSVPSGFTSGLLAASTWSPFKLTVTLSSPQPGMAGYLHARVRAAKPSSTFYIDPMVVLS